MVQQIIRVTSITRKKDFSRIVNPGVPIFLRIILPSKKTKTSKV